VYVEVGYSVHSLHSAVHLSSAVPVITTFLLAFYSAGRVDFTRFVSE
jgi:hypothetical protein